MTRSAVPGAQTGIVMALSSRDLAARERAIRLAGEEKIAEARPLLEVIADSDPDPDLRYLALQALERFEPVTRPGARVPLDLEADALRRNLAASDADIRARSVVALASTLGPEALAPLDELALSETHPLVRCSLIKAMARLAPAGDPGMIRRIIHHFLGDRSVKVRVAALESLGTLEARPAIPVMITRLADPDHRIQAAAAAVLSRWDPWVLTLTAEKMIRDGRPRLVDAATRLLAEKRTEAVIPLLARALDAGVESAKLRALTTLLDMARAGSIPAKQELVDREILQGDDPSPVEVSPPRRSVVAPAAALAAEPGPVLLGLRRPGDLGLAPWVFALGATLLALWSLRPVLDRQRAAGAPVIEGTKSVGKNSSGYWEYRLPVDDSAMVMVPPGWFEMGDSTTEAERPVHRVFLDSYLIDKYEVTNRQYRAFLQATGHREPYAWNDGRFNQEDQPVVGVSWEDAAAYARWAGKRLPSEAEWEKAARGDDRRRYPWGNVAPDHGGPYRANYNPGDYVEDLYRFPAPVGRFQRGISPFGIHDMAGNVKEWCHDWYHESWYQVSGLIDPRGPEKGIARVVRGGGWNRGAAYLTTTFREALVPGMHTTLVIGFRCARDVGHRPEASAPVSASPAVATVPTTGISMPEEGGMTAATRLARIVPVVKVSKPTADSGVIGTPSPAPVAAVKKKRKKGKGKGTGLSD